MASSNLEDNTSGPLYRARIANLPISQRSSESRFPELIDFFVLLVQAILAISNTLFQWLLDCLNFTPGVKDLLCWYDMNERRDFFEPWQHHKQLKTMRMNEV